MGHSSLMKSAMRGNAHNATMLLVLLLLPLTLLL
jgi:hypothetical protein